MIFTIHICTYICNFYKREKNLHAEWKHLGKFLVNKSLEVKVSYVHRSHPSTKGWWTQKAVYQFILFPSDNCLRSCLRLILLFHELSDEICMTVTSNHTVCKSLQCTTVTTTSVPLQRYSKPASKKDNSFLVNMRYFRDKYHCFKF